MAGKPVFGVTSGHTGYGQRLWSVSVVAAPVAAAARTRTTARRSDLGAGTAMAMMAGCSLPIPSYITTSAARSCSRMFLEARTPSELSGNPTRRATSKSRSEAAYIHGQPCALLWGWRCHELNQSIDVPLEMAVNDMLKSTGAEASSDPDSFSQAMSKLRQRYDELKERYGISDITVSVQSVASALGYSSTDAVTLEDMVLEANREADPKEGDDGSCRKAILD
ncbi:hypothetical protein ACP70R_032362 [Stipagrostis hirtigluma subsp. patula]